MKCFYSYVLNIFAGIYEVPMNVVVQSMATALRRYLEIISSRNSTLKDIRFVLFDEQTTSSAIPVFLHHFFSSDLTDSGDEDEELDNYNYNNDIDIAKYVKNDARLDQGSRPYAQYSNADAGDRLGSQSARLSSYSRGGNSRGTERAETEACSICFDEPEQPKRLPCGHVFCSQCIDEQFKHQPKCPNCGKLYGILNGNQPLNGTMTDSFIATALPGYPGVGTIQIQYNFPDGIQSVSPTSM